MNHLTQNKALTKKLPGMEEVLKQLDLHRSKGEKIGFTNGCFDVIHAGHIHLLGEAAKLCDILVIGLNTDDSVKRLKGETRPVNPENARATVLASIQFVDYVLLFGEDTPLRLIKEIRPNILIKGGDYKVEDIVGYDFVSSTGGSTVTIPLLEGFSTTGLLKRSQGE
jgi:D-beta-D-heptose 7-phosphate kinase/D-beta-D-heptose 1-phosphate adenosyltransferase